jgi:hypothetical protein
VAFFPPSINSLGAHIDGTFNKCNISLGFIGMEIFSLQAVEGMLDGLTSMPNDPELMIRYRDIHLRILKALQDPRAYGIQWTNKQVTRYVLVNSYFMEPHRIFS